MTTLKDTAKEIAGCQKCPLANGRKRAVPGEGPENARLMFIGEAPGRNEDEQGRPFVGAAGGFLDQLLTSAGIARRDVFITNIVKCRPPANRDPYPGELAACADYLDRQIAAIGPKVIVTLGRYSMAKFLPGETISKIHGQPQRKGGITYVPMFHPAAALHQERYRPLIEADFRKLPAILAEAERLEAAESKPDEPKPVQLSLF